MWIQDLTMALWMLNDIHLIDCVERIHDNVIYMTSGATYSVPALVEAYEEEYGVSKD